MRPPTAGPFDMPEPTTHADLALVTALPRQHGLRVVVGSSGVGGGAPPTTQDDPTGIG
jgi:hypothetical protein